MNKSDITPKSYQAKKKWPHVLPLMEMKRINAENEKNMVPVIAIDAVTGERKELTYFMFK